MAFNQPDILPAAAEAIYRVLTRAPGAKLSNDSLIERIVPDAGGAGTKVITDTLRELRAVGVVVESGDQLILRDDLAREDREGGMRTIILRSVLREADRQELWADDGTGLSLTGGLDLIRALSWMLLLPVSGSPWSWDGTASAQQEQADHFAELFIRNEERWRPFVRWAAYLGFASTFGDYVLVPDPTAAVSRELRSSLKGRGFQPLTEVVDGLGDVLPVLDRGSVNLAMRERYPIDWEPQLSPALTLALTRLRAAGRVELDEGRGDGEKLLFADDQGAYHAIRWTSESA